MEINVGKIFKKLFEVILALFIGLLFVCVLKDLYDWFLLSKINIILSFWEMYGIKLFFGLMFYKYKEIKEKNKKEKVDYYSTLIVVCLVLWGMGYLIKTYLV